MRCLVCADGYPIQNIRNSSITPGEIELEYQQWYQWYFNMERGRAGLEKSRKEIAEKVWRMWSPDWFDEKLFEREAQSFENPELVARQFIPIATDTGTWRATPHSSHWR